ncbi:hypothetical protein GCM10023322_83300 [Rugosimonospora acidiphila]|uniref:Peptidase M48 domain-containing protein n=1 Tax=Rugosimonospora acidiphila TaxID=556531 RepID=A0ABP9SWN6_9ACTN
MTDAHGVGAAATAEPSPLPPPSTSRLAALTLAALAGAVFAGQWYLVLGASWWGAANQGCVVTDPDPVRSVANLLACTDRVRAEQALAILLGPAAVAVLAGLAYLAIPRLIRWRCGTEPLPAGSRLAVAFAALVSSAGLDRPPVIEARPRLSYTDTPFTYGRPPYRVVVPGLMKHAVEEHGLDPTGEVSLRHELAHIQGRDVRRTYLAIATWLASSLIVVGPLPLAAAYRAGGLGLALGWRLVAVAVLLWLALLAVFRTREHEADLRVARTDPAAVIDALVGTGSRPGPPPGAGVGRGDPPPGARGGRGLRWRSLWRFHPTRPERADVVRSPVRVLRPSTMELLVTGVATGLVGTELGVVLDGLLPADAWYAYLCTGALLCVPLMGVLGLGTWRASLARGGSPPAVPAGLALGLGLVAGTQLAPRAAADWWRVFASAGGQADVLSLTAADRGCAALLVAGAALLGLLAAQWSAATAGAWARTRHPRRGCAAALAVGGLCLAVPLGTWLLAVRVAASSAEPPSRLVAHELSGPRQPALLAAAALAWGFTLLGPLLHAGRPHPPGRAPRPAAWWLPAAAWALGLAVILAAPAVARGPATPVAAPPPMPATRQSFYTCRWLKLGGPSVLGPPADGDSQRALGLRLMALDDPAVRAIGQTLVTSAERGDPGLAAAAQLALLRRCDILISFGRYPSAQATHR